MMELVRHRQTKGSVTDRPHLNHRVTPRLYIYPLVADAIAAQLYDPRRDAPTCARRYCSHWRSCQREFGGEARVTRSERLIIMLAAALAAGIPYRACVWG
jgi:hypothetical protein